MYSNSYDLLLQHVLEQKGLKSPNELRYLWALLDRLNNAGFGGDLRPAIAPPGERFLPHEAFGFAILWASLLRGDVAYNILTLPARCGYDRDSERNNAVLKSAQFKPEREYSAYPLRWNAQFSGGTGDNDGFFETLSPFLMNRHIVSAGSCEVQTVSVQPRKYPLEVGSTHVATTVMHVLSEYGLARWPYGVDSLYLFHKLHEREHVTVLNRALCDCAGGPLRRPAACAQE